MTKRPFGKTSLFVSILGFGAAPVAYLQPDRERSVKVIESLLDAGVDFIDTAASYPGSEQFLGDHFSHRRDEFILVSKCGQTIPESDAPAWSEPTITATVDRALRNLQTDHVDVMLLHSCSLDILQKGEALGALMKARDAGKIRFIGFSGDNEPAAFCAAVPDVAVIELSINIADQSNIDNVLPIARKNNVGIIAKRPIANAAWKEVSQQPGMYKHYSKTYTERLRQMGVPPSSVGFNGAGGDAALWPEMALRFTLSIPGVHTAIIGTTSPENAAANVRYANAGPLPEDVTRKLRGAFHKADPERKWMGQT